MRSYTEVERELLFLKTAVSLLERADIDWCNGTPVKEPAYWRSRLEHIVDAWPRDSNLESKAREVSDRLQRLSARDGMKRLG
ncbi:hypothetical protein AWB77_05891 [Caballeronia fortuita]|uniref:Uncharacterized protein n=1 Tax=Caballeronia fortuita TaxID=1777138 RepID=A0A158DVW8_9BURK|nr:hypothetical protein [Caballeronia fortuita]SAK98789.1 hypothetical protein AWB77_05891 [Caballeronia fortuita]